MGLLREHWRLAGELLCLLLLAGTTWQAFHREPAPAIHEKLEEHAAEAIALKTDVHEDVGGWSISDLRVRPGKRQRPLEEPLGCQVLTRPWRGPQPARTP
jgi:hypothetical protein